MVLIATITYTITDAKGKSGRVRFYSNVDADNTFGFGNFNSPFEDACEYFQEVGRRIDLLLKGQVSNIAISVDLPLAAGIKVSPTADSDVEEIALFKWRDGERAWENTLPGFDHALFGTAQVIQAIAEAEIFYFTQFIGNPAAADDWTGSGGGITNNRGDDVSNDNPFVYKKFRR